MKYKYLFFDLDGTLTDPAEGITNSVIYSLKKFNIEIKDRTTLYKFIGPPLVDSFMKFYGFDEKKAWTAVEYYREYFSVSGLFENKVYDGIENLLDTLQKQGHKLYVATSKPKEYSVRILDKFGLLKYFEYVSGSSMDEKDSDKATIIKNALNVSLADKKDVLMIGDRCFDIKGAKINGIDSLAVLYGYGSREEITDSAPEYIVETVNDIFNYV